MKNLFNIIDSTIQFNLSNVITKRASFKVQGWDNFSLTQEELKEVAKAVIDCLGGRQKTKDLIYYNILNERVNTKGIFERVYFTVQDDRLICRYMAGQSYTEEVAYVRNLLKK